MALENALGTANAVASLPPAARIATANGTGVDTAGFQSVDVVVQFGTWTDGTHTPSLQESVDNATFTAVAAADLVGAFTAVSGAGGNNTAQRVGYKGGQRFVRAVMTVAGATTGAVSAAVVVRGRAVQG